MSKKAEVKRKKTIPYIVILLMIIIPLLYLIYWENIINPKPIEGFQQKLDSVRKALAEETASSMTLSDKSMLEEILAAEQNVQNNPSESGFINLGLVYYKAKRYYDCVEATKKAVLINPQCSLAYNNICSAYNELGLWGEAAKAGKKALEINPKFELAKNNLQVSKSNREKLYTEINQATIIAVNNPSLDNYILLGNLHYRNADYKTAINAYEEALKLHPNHPMAYNNICSCYNIMENWELAVKFCNKALLADPNLEIAKNNLAIAKRKMSEKSK